MSIATVVAMVLKSWGTNLCTHHSSHPRQCKMECVRTSFLCEYAWHDAAILKFEHVAVTDQFALHSSRRLKPQFYTEQNPVQSKHKTKCQTKSKQRQSSDNTNYHNTKRTVTVSWHYAMWETIWFRSVWTDILRGWMKSWITSETYNKHEWWCIEVYSE